MWLICLALAIVGYVVVAGAIDGKVVGTDVIFFGVCGLVGAIGVVVVPFFYFTRLGIYLGVKSGRLRGNYYFSATDFQAK